MFLKNSVDGYDIYVMGKNGEPKKGMLIKIELLHKFINEKITQVLKTDDMGKI